MVDRIILTIRLFIEDFKKKFKSRKPKIEAPKLETKENHIDLAAERKKSFLTLDRVYITENIYIKIPTVREILKNEQNYYSAVHSLTAVPYQFMVQLDDMKLDFATVKPYELFLMLFPVYAKSDLSLILGDLNTSDYTVKLDDSNSTYVLYSKTNGDDFKIDELVYTQFVDTLRKIHNLEKVKYKPGTDEAKEYLIKKERRKQKRRANKPYEPYLEKLVIALVNCPEYKYNYEETLDLSIYKFNQSFKQVQTRINFDNTMTGVYAGTVDTSKLSDKSCLSWIPIKQ